MRVPIVRGSVKSYTLHSRTWLSPCKSMTVNRTLDHPLLGLLYYLMPKLCGFAGSAVPKEDVSTGGGSSASIPMYL